MIGDSRFLNTYIGALKADMDDLAHASCNFPKSDPFQHGAQVGNYQGLQAALKRLEGLIEADAEEERKK